ncbi:MAG: nitroreductase [Roseovarius sp.]
MPADFESLAARRRSVRAYLDKPVDRETVEALLRIARQAPSGANLQPGRFHALAGAPLERLKAVLAEAQAAGVPEVREYSWFPDPMPPELKARQRAAGYALYEALGIARRDVAGRRAQFARNYAFFDAPVGIVVTIDREMGKGGFMDLGMALMSFLLAAEDRGLGATGIGALANYGPRVAAHLGLPEGEMVVCGLALGWPDEAARATRVQTAREPLEGFARFEGFEG